MLDQLRRWQDPLYRQYRMLRRRLGTVPRRTRMTCRVLGVPTELVDFDSFVFAFREILLDGCYAFTTQARQPVVVDVGANIGLAAIAIHRQHPRARITCIEADPMIASALRENLRRWGMRDATVIQAAAWTHNNGVSFRDDHADGGCVDGNGKPIASIDLARALPDSTIHLLKMDVEGAEHQLIPHIADALPRIERIVVEIHTRYPDLPGPGAILHTLESAGMRTHVAPVWNAHSPLVSRPTPNGFENQLNVYAWREGLA